MGEQLDLFASSTITETKLTIRVLGQISIDSKAAKKKIDAICINQNISVDFKADAKGSDIKRETDIIVWGTEPNEEAVKRLVINKHDGWCPTEYSESEFLDILNGLSPISKTNVKKNLVLSVEHYNWNPPIREDLVNIRKSSPIDYSAKSNPIYGAEIFVPEDVAGKSSSLRQIIGNLGGYASNELYEDTQIIMLSKASYNNLINGISDPTIKHIEETYNKESSPAFDMPFTNEEDFINWVGKRCQTHQDSGLSALLESYKS